ncbi:DUF1206 domain-containing protein [Serinicoccus profundi]|uniref:DUF1206 domain-containing protein n=1 Tax=Serinicoccus profundi TaxID=1078471 RepID=UPI000255E6E1
MLACVSRDIVHEGSRKARQVADHPWLEKLARIGFAASGLIHVLIGGIALRVALGSGGEADQGGALQAVREAPAGALILWVCVLGFLALALFQLLDGLLGGGEIGDRVKAVGKGVLYAALGLTTLTFARGGSSDSSQSSQDLTATLMQAPLGRVLVGIVGLAVIGVGGYHLYKGATKKFLEDLKSTGGASLGTGVTVTGMVGYIAKGVALLVVGGLFAIAAWQADPEEAQGMDGALKMLAGQPFGTALLVVVAVGLVAYGVYSFARARYARMD